MDKKDVKQITDAVEKHILAMAVATVSYLRDDKYSSESIDRTKEIAKTLNSYYVDALDFVVEDGMP